jgi:hypothetical protein
MIKRLVATLIVLIPLASYSNDWQFWNTDNIQYKNVKVESEFYFDNSDCYYKHLDVGYSDNILKWLEAGINYRYITDDDKEENRIHGNITFKKKLSDLKLSDRNRFEYRIKENDTDWRYRNKVKLEYSLSLISPYVDDEVFIPMTNQDSVEINQNRISTGLNVKITDWSFVKIYVMLVSEKNNSEWKDTNVIGTEVSLKF